MSKAHIFRSETPLLLESGAELPCFELAYHTYGSPDKPVVWICHALTANSDAEAWWPGLVGNGCLFNPTDYYLVCANVLGSCYGSTNALAEDPSTGNPYFHTFPLLTVRDMVRALDRLRRHLGISYIHTLIGGSMGGQQALEWAVQQPDLFEHLIPIATNAQHSPWGIAFNESQRMAIAADPTWQEDRADAGLAGLKAARAIAMLSYRNYDTYLGSQSEKEEGDKLEGFRAATYQAYQGEKLTKRFDTFSYVTLSKAMDSHNLGRGRGGVAQALGTIRAKTLVIGITSDVLFPIEEQYFLGKNIPNARFISIESSYGHDGFLIESEALAKHIGQFYAEAQALEAKRA